MPSPSNGLVSEAVRDLAMRAQYAREVERLAMDNVLLRRLLIEHGITPPVRSGERLDELWADCQAVIAAAQELVAKLPTGEREGLLGR